MNRRQPVWLFGTVAIGLLMLSLLLWQLQMPATAGPAPLPDQREVAHSAVAWLINTHQNDDGGYTSFSQGANASPSTVGGTVDAMLAIASTGHSIANPYPFKTNAPLDYIAANSADVAAYATVDGAQAGKLILALSAAHQDPTSYMGYNFAISLTNQLSPTGQFGVSDPFKQSLAILGLTAVSETVPMSATQWLKDQQAADGSWDDGFGTLRNPDATAIAIMALIAADTSLNDSSIVSATTFLADSQLPTGGWEYGAGFGENANTTGLVVQALNALGEDFYTGGSSWATMGVSPLAVLLSYANSETGAFEADFGFGPFDDFFTTVQAIPATIAKPYPLASRTIAAKLGSSCMADIRDSGGGWELIAGDGVNAGGTARAIEAIVAIGGDPHTNSYLPTANVFGSPVPVAALENLTPDYLADGRGERVGIVMQAVALAGAPADVANFAGGDLTISMTTYLSPTGQYGNSVTDQAEAMLGLILAGETPDANAIQWLADAQMGGSWGDVSSTGLALNVLARLRQSVPNSISTLSEAQLANGGWAATGMSANPSVSSEVVQGLVQAGENPFSPQWSVVVSGTVLNVGDLIMAQQQDDGCWLTTSGTPAPDPFSTTDAIVLLTQDAVWKEYSIALPILFSAGG